MRKLTKKSTVVMAVEAPTKEKGGEKRAAGDKIKKVVNVKYQKVVLPAKAILPTKEDMKQSKNVVLHLDASLLYRHSHIRSCPL
ncbi:hypothetical protein GUJ93_ZPchr0180g33731 [Zizania palustris]|uniref:Uncharacterized protein n=1 Tax=Zizania palustris TaxID=103762 RepID=A0A8J5V859_ZIZPA|nr:hypothetical protein GUJ93_ZPchr0180g33731 [Zizania palustris]